MHADSMHVDTHPIRVVLLGVALAVAFLVGLLAQTPTQACALDADCARAPVSTQ